MYQVDFHNDSVSTIRSGTVSSHYVAPETGDCYYCTQCDMITIRILPLWNKKSFLHINFNQHLSLTVADV